jgi:hypothetical protein
MRTRVTWMLLLVTLRVARNPGVLCRTRRGAVEGTDPAKALL